MLCYADAVRLRFGCCPKLVVMLRVRSIPEASQEEPRHSLRFFAAVLPEVTA
ncbi:MAG: hypothetical protein K9L75_03375 [Spirochaetia bacterium]|nr:hypothetical protein [Spirochaetia bacterium]